MKKLPVTLACAVLLAALMSSVWAAEPLKLGPDGYGKVSLPNGIIVLVNQDKSTQLSAARILIGGGSASETKTNNGINNLLVSMLLKGNSSMTAAQISDRLDFYGATVSADCFRDFSAISISSLSENFDKVLEIISNCMLSPTFPPEELTKLKTEVAGEIKAAQDNQTQASSDLFWKTAYGDQGYGLPTLGTAESVGTITADDLKKQYAATIGGNNIIIAIATDLPVEKIADIAQTRFGGIKPQATKPAPPSVALQPDKSGFISFDRNQSFVFMGYLLDRLNPQELACVGLLNQVMGGPVGSRLWDLRQKEKLAYAVYTQYSANNSATVFRAAIGTDTSKVRLALASLEREWAKLRDSGITASELSDAKVNMKNSLIYAVDRKAVRANNMAFYEYLGYGFKFPLELMALSDKMSLADVNNFVKARLADDRKYLSIVGKR